MTTASKASESHAIPPGFTKLAAGGELLKRTAGFGSRLKRWGLRLILVAVVLVVVLALFVVAVGIATNLMWFRSVHAGSVYTTMIWARVGLFCVFGVIAAGISGATYLTLRRVHRLAVSQDTDTVRWTFLNYERKFWKLLAVLSFAVPGILVGKQAASGWQTYLLWQHATPFHTTDATFHKDVSFYIEIYPFHQMVVSLLQQSVTYALWISVIGGYLYATWRIRRGQQKVSRGYIVQLTILAAGYLVVKAGQYWLSHYAVVTSSRGPVTGAGYTDVHATVPGAYAMTVIALVGAAVLTAHAVLAGRGKRFFGRVRGLVGTLVLVAVASVAAYTGVPGLVYHFRESPSASSLDLSEISHNLKATRTAFGLDGDISTIGYSSSTGTSSGTSSGTTSAASLVSLANKTAQIPVIDPNQLSPTFNVEQQLQSYYNFKSTLDVSHYDIGGKSQDVVLAVRELRSSGIPKGTWVNKHLVYTHGYGIVAAPTTEVDSKTESPKFLDGGMPPSQQITVTRPQIYFGQGFASGTYAIAGQPKGSKTELEFDHPAGSGSSKSTHTTYTGNGGVPIGSTLRRLLFAVQLHDPNILFSSELNSASQLLEVRDPRTRVAKVAPWLTLDGNVYPAVVDGHIKWIVDGYTTTSNYPDSQETNLKSATNTTLVSNGSTYAQPSTQINYMHNSVKAVVDAYTGKVSLYEWNQKQSPDPLLKAWEHVFPGLVKPQSDISSALMSQLRYPTDLFNVQRTLLAKYHVTSASNFYSGNDFWTVPSDPTVAATNSINSSSSSASTAAMPSRYMSMSADGYGEQAYSLSSPMVTLNGHDLASFVYVNSEPGPDYGKFTILEYPSAEGGEAPSQVQNDIESNTTITEALTLQRGGNSKVVLGDLEAIPLAGKLLYVEPVYTQSTGASSFPVLRHVIALYDEGDPSFETELQASLKQAIENVVGSG